MKRLLATAVIAALLTLSVQAQNINCALAIAPDEVKICKTPELLSLHRRMVNEFNDAAKIMLFPEVKRMMRD